METAQKEQQETTQRRIVKYRLITWFTTVDDPTAPGGLVKREHIATMGQTIDLPESEAARLDDQSVYPGGALYTAEEQAAIEDGTYTGFDRHLLAQFRTTGRPAPAIEAADGEGVNTSDMDAEALGEYIKEHRLNVDQTVKLLPEDASEDDINKLYDAENYATENDPRKGVTDRLDARLAARTQQ